MCKILFNNKNIYQNTHRLQAQKAAGPAWQVPADRQRQSADILGYHFYPQQLVLHMELCQEMSNEKIPSIMHSNKEK